jgi:hypothetical protein
MRALPLSLFLTMQTIGEWVLWARLGISWTIVRPLVVNGACWAVAAVIDLQRRKLFQQSTPRSA